MSFFDELIGEQTCPLAGSLQDEQLASLYKESELASKRGPVAFRNYCQGLTSAQLQQLLELQETELKGVDSIKKYCARRTDRTFINTGMVALGNIVFFALCYIAFYQMFVHMN